MDADFSIELAREDPVLDFPWTDPSGEFAYVDLKRHPERMPSITEAQSFPALAEFLRALNSPQSPVETAKCDAWTTTGMTAEEQIYTASHKFACYVDVVFTEVMLPENDARFSLSAHEQFARKLVAALQHTPQIPSQAEVCVRRCYFAQPGKQDTKRKETKRKDTKIKDTKIKDTKRKDRKRENAEVREGFYCTLYVSGYGNDEPSARQNWELALKLAGNAILR